MNGMDLNDHFPNFGQIRDHSPCYIIIIIHLYRINN